LSKTANSASNSSAWNGSNGKTASAKPIGLSRIGGKFMSNPNIGKEESTGGKALMEGAASTLQ